MPLPSHCAPFKFAGFSGPHPSLVVDCPTCAAPAGYYCNRDSEPAGSPHEHRRLRAGTVDAEGLADLVEGIREGRVRA